MEEAQRPVEVEREEPKYKGESWEHLAARGGNLC